MAIETSTVTTPTATAKKKNEREKNMDVEKCEIYKFGFGCVNHFVCVEKCENIIGVSKSRQSNRKVIALT